MIERTRKATNHLEFGSFISREIKLLAIERESFRSTCHMSQPYLEDIKKGSTIMR